MRTLLLGRAEDCCDYLAHARTRNEEVVCWQPPSLAAVPRERWAEHLGRAEDRDLAAGTFDAVLSFSDGHQVAADLLAERHGLPARGVDALVALTDKERFRSEPAIAGDVVPHLTIAPELSPREALDIATRFAFPVVLKPARGFYSLGVVRVDDADRFVPALAQARRATALLEATRGLSAVLVEPYLDGEEYAIDGFVSRGAVRPLLFHRKWPPLQGPYFHEIGYVTEPFDPERGCVLLGPLERVLRAFGLNDSWFHAEFRFDGDGRLWLLEVAPRAAGGGATSEHLLRNCTGLSAYELIGRLADGVNPEPTRHAVGIEFDAVVEHSGTIKGFDKAVRACEAHRPTALLRHAEDGKYVLGAPLNAETVLTAFYVRDTIEDGKRLVSDLQSSVHIDTGRAS